MFLGFYRYNLGIYEAIFFVAALLISFLVARQWLYREDGME